jgi:myo-inositol-hexaphosphate 3-phosphohydrolase
MKKWETLQSMAQEICEIDKRICKDSKELNIAQASHIASVAIKLYKKGGCKNVIDNITNTMKSRATHQHQSLGLTLHEKLRAKEIIDKLFFWHWFPFSRINQNMKRLAN